MTTPHVFGNFIDLNADDQKAIDNFDVFVYNRIELGMTDFDSIIEAADRSVRTPVGFDRAVRVQNIIGSFNKVKVA